MGRLVVLLVCVTSTALMCLGIDRAKEEAFIGKRRNWWSFQKPVRPAVPDVKDAWVSNAIDAFILQALRDKQLSPSPPLEKRQLIRRVTLDLTGLPPSPEEVEAFLADNSPDAYAKVVDRLLASPHYGERWAQRWLDVARYADTNGYELDLERPHAWRYRDYVVQSFNADKPYERFLREQVAGDEIFPGDKQALIATGFHRAGPIHLVSGNQDYELNRQEVLMEMTSAIGSVFMGVTMGCARCHDHKFDPVLQSDYYRLQAIFATTWGEDVEIATAAERDHHRRAMAEWNANVEPISKQIKEIEKPYREKLREQKKAKLPAELRAALDVPKDLRTPEQKTLASNAMSQIGLTWDEVVGALTPEDKAKRAALRRQLHDLELIQPDPLPAAYAVQNIGSAPPTHILKIGDPHHRLDYVDPGLPTAIVPDNGNVTLQPHGRRTALANWLASAEHPLTARVMVNRIWQLRMGAGLVRTPNDFGVLGERPTNKALLDWLATEFVAQKWSVKAMDRMILLSSAYRQSAADDPAKSAVDAENKLYWRAHRRRLEAENLRDSVLSVTGKLNPRLGGKPVKVPIEQEIYDIIFTEAEPDNLWPVLPDEREHHRRSIYLLNKRTVRLPMMSNFDQPDAMTSCPVRPTSTHALQALSLMNSDFMQAQSKAFAGRLEAACGADSRCRLEKAYQLTLARPPKPAETAMAEKFFSDGGLLADFCLALLNRNEFVYLP